MDVSTVLVVFPNGGMEFHSTEKLTPGTDHMRMNTLIGTTVCMGPVRRDDIGNSFQVHYGSFDNEKFNKIGHHFTGGKPGTSRDGVQRLTGPVGFLKYRDGKLVDFEPEDLEWIRNYDVHPIPSRTVWQFMEDTADSIKDGFSWFLFGGYSVEI